MISGFIKDVRGGSLPFSTVTIKNSNQGTVANDEGYFSLNVMRLPVSIIVTSMGFISSELVLTSGSDVENLTIELEPAQLNINEIVVKGKSTATQIEQKGFTVTSVSLKSIQTQSIELNQILNQTAGINVRAQGGLGSKVNYSINGLGGSAVRFFMDGIPMKYFGSSYSVNTIPVSQISRIDVYKGAVPVELGSDALGGAINLVTNKNKKNALNLDYTVGSFNTHKASVYGFGKAKNGLTGRISAFYNYSDNNYKVWGDDISVTDPVNYEVRRGIRVNRFHDAYQSKAVKADVGISQKKWAEHLFFGLLLSTMDKDIQHGATMTVPFGEATYQQEVWMPYVDYRNKNMFKNKMEISVWGSYSVLEHHRVDTSRNVYDWFGQVIRNNSFGEQQSRQVDLTLTDKAGTGRSCVKYSITSSMKVTVNQVHTYLVRKERDPFVSTNDIDFQRAQHFRKSFTGVALERIWINERLKSNVFYKRNSLSADVKEFVPNKQEYDIAENNTIASGYGIALDYNAGAMLNLQSSFELTSRLPEPNELLGNGGLIIANSKLDAEKSMNINFGFNLYLLQGKEHNVNLSAGLYYRKVDQLISKRPTDRAFQYINFDKVNISGVDGRIRYSFKNSVKLFQSISYLNPVIKSDKDELGRDNGLADTKLGNTPFFKTSSELRFETKKTGTKNIDAFLSWHYGYVARFYRYDYKYGSQNKDFIPSQNIHSIGVGYTFSKPKLTLSGKLSNVFNAQAFDNYAVQKPGRSVYVKLSFQII